MKHLVSAFIDENGELRWERASPSGQYKISIAEIISKILDHEPTRRLIKQKLDQIDNFPRPEHLEL